MICCFKDPTDALMRVLLCKIQCPSFICFCKPSPHIYAAGLLKLENTPEIVLSEEDVNHVDAFVKEEKCSVDEKEEKEEEEEEEEKEEEVERSVEILKSSFKKAVLDSTDESREKKKVQWSDLMGKELAQIREFQSSEEDDIDYDGVKSCVCVIL